MNRLKSVTIKNIWGKNDIEIDLKKDVNIIIGVNGTGKTTLINLIAAALNVNLKTLTSIQFDTIEIILDSFEKNKKPSILLTKTKSNNEIQTEIVYKIRDMATGPITEYRLDLIEERLSYRRVPRHSRSKDYEQVTRIINDDGVEGLKDHLAKLIDITWLTIHRGKLERGPSQYEYESTVDQKLNEFQDRFIRYCFYLSRMSSYKQEEFQKSVFLSLVSSKSSSRLFINFESLNISDEHKSLEEIFDKFKLTEEKHKKTLEKHFSNTQKIVQKIHNKEKYDFEDFQTILEAIKTHSMVEEWKKTTAEIEKVYEPLNCFFSIVNDLLYKKKLQRNEKYELIVETDLGHSLTLNKLSSGEKQLLILLGEALLKHGHPITYIADEPELSLHITWQNALISCIKKINPCSQILFATHSPDIVSNYSKNVLDMEKILK